MFRSRRCFQRAGSVSSWVPPVDAVGRPPHCDFADEGRAWVALRWRPDWLGVTLAGVVLDLVGEVGDELGSLCQVVAPDGMVMECFRYAREPRQRTWVGRRQRCEAPVDDGGHVAGSAEVSSAGGCQHVAQWVLSSFGREGEQVGSEVGQAGSVASPGRYWSAWSSSATVWGPRSRSAAT